MGDGFGARSVARWQGEALEVTTTSERSRRLERFELEPGGERLLVTLTLAGDATPEVNLRLVYDLTPREPGARAAEEPSTPIPGEAPATAEPSQGSPGPSSATATSSTRWVGERPVVERARVVDPPATPPSAAVGPASADAEEPARTASRSTVVRLIPPLERGQRALAGRAVIEALTLDERVAVIEFFLDDARVARKTFPPFEAKIELDTPPREQRVRAVALDGHGDRLGEDELVLNRVDLPFRVRIVEVVHQAGASAGTPRTRVRATVTVPSAAKLERVVFYRNEEIVVELAEAPFEVELTHPDRGDGTAGPGPSDFVRVVATLAGGREVEDVALLAAADVSERVDVQLAQVQVLVTDGRGEPAEGLGAGDFEVADGGRPRAVDRVDPSANVELLLGLAVDSSGSMGPLWPQTRFAASRFLERTLGARDRAFLVDFDSGLRLLQEPTGDRSALERAMEQLEPFGGTALYDSILFSMMQFGIAPGRRALIVITDGFDTHSRADPARAIELGKRLGVPVYVISMNIPGSAGVPPGFAGVGARGGLPDGASARANLRLITEPTGGRLYQVGSSEQVERAFEQIERELRLQYVLSFYTDRAPETVPDTKVRVRRKGLEVRSALPLEPADAP
jgi:VWFA-related protein